VASIKSNNKSDLKMNNTQTQNNQTVDPLTLHDRQAEAITKAVAKLFLHLAPQGYSPEAIFEGVVKGGAVAVLSATNADLNDVGKMLEIMAAEFIESGQSEGKSLQ
jgi:hypothetical protein